MHRKEINAMLDTDLPSFLEKVGLLEQFNSGQIKCSNCCSTINSDNAFAIYNDDGIKFCCNLSPCIRFFNKR